MKQALALVGLLAVTTPALADGLDRSLVPAEAKWVAHVDIEGFQKTILAKSVMQLIEDSGENLEEAFGEMEAEIGMHPLRDFKSITVFSASENPENAVALVKSTARVDAALSRVQQEENYRTYEAEGIQLHTWEDGGDEAGLVYIHNSGENARIVLLSQNKTELMRAARVLRSDAPSLSRNRDSRLVHRPAAGSFLFVDVSEGLEHLGEIEPMSKVAELARGFTVDVGESAGRFFADVRIEAADGQKATQMADIVRGAKAMVGMMAGSADVPLFVQDLLEAIQISNSGTQVRVQLSIDSRTLVEELKELADEDY